jgi:hypothetical protein
MSIPATGAVSMLTVRNEYAGQFVYLTTYSSSNTDLFNMNYYRGKWNYRLSDGVLQQFPSGAISLNDFRNTSAADPSPPPPPPPSPPGP